MINKEARYNELIEKVKRSYLLNPNDLTWCDDCKEINLWTYWQGRGNLDAKILLVGQDWGAPDEPEAENVMKNIRLMNAGVSVPYMKGNFNPTDQTLIRLFHSIGYDIAADSADNHNLFFTNLVLGYRSGKISGGLQQKWIEHDSDFFRELVSIIEPKTILCLGKDTFIGVLKALKLPTPKIKRYNEYLDQQRKPIVFQHDSGEAAGVFALAHCGVLGSLNRNRGYAEKCNNISRQMNDWNKVSIWNSPEKIRKTNDSKHSNSVS